AKGSAHEFSPEEARIAGSKGGRAAHQRGSAHEFTSEEARAAGRKGGESSSLDRSRMAEIGREGGPRRPRHAIVARARLLLQGCYQALDLDVCQFHVFQAAREVAVV